MQVYMQNSEFDEAAAFQHLKCREKIKATNREEVRKNLLKKITTILFDELKTKNIEVWLIGSIIQPNKFSERSDIDIVVNGYRGDRFYLWTLLEAKIGHAVEIIRYEECGFQDDIIKYGLKVL